MHRRRGLVVSLAAFVAVGNACAADDDAGSTAATDATVATPATVTTEATIRTVVAAETTMGPPEGLEVLGAGLLSAAEVGVPDDWLILDLDPLAPADVLAARSSDPFLGLLDCDDGVLPGPDDVWLSRTFSTSGEPQADGLLSIAMIMVRQDEDEFAELQRGFASCRATEQGRFDAGDGEVVVSPEAAEAPSTRPTEALSTTGASSTRPAEAPATTVAAEGTIAGSVTPTVEPLATVAATTIHLFTAPSAAVAYPSQFTATSANYDGVTVIVVIGGLDQGADWDGISANIAGRLLWMIASRAE